jgi:hypothetical protein
MSQALANKFDVLTYLDVYAAPMTDAALSAVMGLSLADTVAAVTLGVNAGLIIVAPSASLPGPDTYAIVPSMAGGGFLNLANAELTAEEFNATLAVYEGATATVQMFPVAIAAAGLGAADGTIGARYARLLAIGHKRRANTDILIAPGARAAQFGDIAANYAV